MGFFLGGFLQGLAHFIINDSDEILAAWTPRIRQLLPEPARELAPTLAQQLWTALTIFIVDDDLDAAVHHLERIGQEILFEIPDALSVITKALLLSRYILLPAMIKHNGGSSNSLQTFSDINDQFEPLLLRLSTLRKGPEPPEQKTLSGDFIKAAELGLLRIDFAGIGLFVVDAQNNVLYWGESLTPMYGISAAEMVGQNLTTRMAVSEKMGGVQRAIRDALLNGEEVELWEDVHRSVTNKELMVDCKIAPVRDSERRIIGASVLVHDITERRERERALQKYERYFENILHDAADAIIILDAQDRIVMWNKAAEAIYGWRKEEVVGKPVGFIVPDDSDSRKEIDWINAEVRKKGYVRNFRTHRLTREGKKVTIEVSRTAIKDETGQFIGSSVISRDMTQNEQLRNQLVHSEKLSAVGTLAAGIAHEIGTPLTAISSLSQLLRAKSNDPFFTEKIALIQQSIDRISRIVRTLVDFSRPIKQKIENVYLNSVIEDVVHIIKYDRRLKYRDVKAELTPQIPQVRASFDQLLQVFINICLNAADAMEQISEGKLLIRTWCDDEMVYASVSDNGTGISPEHLPHIFEPFFTTKAEGKGTGLGLWVSYNIVKAYSGELSVTSAPGEGTTFIVSLPVLAEVKAE